MKIQGFDWDRGNLNKVQKHGPTLELIEGFLLSSPWTRSGKILWQRKEKVKK